MLKRLLLGVGLLLLAAIAAAGVFVWMKVRAYDASMAKVYAVAPLAVERSADPAVLERGKHLAESLGACHACHGANLAGGRVEDFGPLGRLVAPNITAGRGGLGASYSDGELARLVKHGLRKDGTSVRFMPSHEISWWPDEDVRALVSYVRTLPPVDATTEPSHIGLLGKLLDRLDLLTIDVARRIRHDQMPRAPAPSATAEYGFYVGQLCTGCHGARLSGGPIPGAPPELPVPLNLTPHESGLKDWSYADFEKLMREGVRKNGQKLHPFMPIETTRNFSDVELQALWAHLRAVPAVPFGQR